MSSIPRRLGRIAAGLGFLAALGIAAWAALHAAWLVLAPAAAAGAFSVATFRAFNAAPRPPAAFAWAGFVVFVVGAFAARDWLVAPLTVAAAGYLAAAVASSAWRYRTRHALT